MNLSALIVTAMTLIACTSTETQTVDITRGDSRPVRPGATEHFTAPPQGADATVRTTPTTTRTWTRTADRRRAVRRRVEAHRVVAARP